MHDFGHFCSFQVNDEVVTLPLLREPYIYVERQTNTILLNTNIGLKVQSFVICCVFKTLHDKQLHFHVLVGRF